MRLTHYPHPTPKRQGVTGYSPGRYSILTMALLNRWSEQSGGPVEDLRDVSEFSSNVELHAPDAPTGHPSQIAH